MILIQINWSELDLFDQSDRLISAIEEVKARKKSNPVKNKCWSTSIK